MHSSDSLLLRLNLIESVVLEAVHTAEWQNVNGQWRPIPPNNEKKKEVADNWRIWQEDWKELAVPQWGEQLSSMIEHVRRAVGFEIAYSGGQSSNRWRVIFEYKQAFSALYEKVKAALKEDEEFQFRRRYEDKFTAFTGTHGDKINVFVAIEYSEAAEVAGIFEYLENLHYTVATPLGIHFAKDRDWIDGLHDNLVFYMIACQAGMAFFTSANLSVKKALHNPNVIYEFGFMRGLGKKCKMFIHKDVTAFTDVRGLVYDEYTTLGGAKKGVKRFLEQDVGISFKSGS